MAYNPCNLKIKTINCCPSNRVEWFKHKLPEDVDPVRSNIVNGCWECNYDEDYVINSTLCDRSFNDGFYANPHKRIEYIDINSKLTNRGIPLGRYNKSY